MSLTNVLEEIKKVAPFALENVDSGNPATLTVRRGRKRNAVEQLKVLKRQYRDELLRSAAFIVTTGSEKDAYVQLASTSGVGNCFSSDPETLAKSVASQIDAQLYKGKTSNSSLFEVVGRVLENKALDLDILAMPLLLFKAHYVKSLNTEEDLSKLIREAVNEQIGPEIAGIQAVQSLVDIAIEKGHDSSVTPIVLGTDDPKFAMDLVKSLTRLNPKVYLVVAGKGTKTLKSLPGAILVKEVNEDTVKESLETVRKSLKK